MAENRDQQKPNQTDQTRKKEAKRQERLSKALRDNLKKRRQPQAGPDNGDNEANGDNGRDGGQ